MEGWSARIPKIRKPGRYSYSTHVAVMFSLLSRIVGLLRSRQPWPAGAGPSFPVASPDFQGGWISCECLGRIYETQICTCRDEHPAPAPHPRPNLAGCSARISPPSPLPLKPQTPVALTVLRALAAPPVHSCRTPSRLQWARRDLPGRGWGGTERGSGPPRSVGGRTCAARCVGTCRGRAGALETEDIQTFRPDLAGLGARGALTHPDTDTVVPRKRPGALPSAAQGASKPSPAHRTASDVRWGFLRSSELCTNVANTWPERSLQHG